VDDGAAELADELQRPAHVLDGEVGKRARISGPGAALVQTEPQPVAVGFSALSELGMELEGETTVEGPWVDQTVGLDDVRADIAMMRTPDGHGRVELSRFHRPPAVRAEPESAPANALGMRGGRLREPREGANRTGFEPGRQPSFASGSGYRADSIRP
jgi:hypothetical protein